MVVYVDNLLLASKSIETIRKVKTELHAVFKLKDLGPISEILGMQIEREGDVGSIRISQKKYVQELIERFRMSQYKPASTPLPSGIK